MAVLSAQATNVNWLVNNFVDHVPGVSEAVVVSSDGLPIAASSGSGFDGKLSSLPSGEGEVSAFPSPPAAPRASRSRWARTPWPATRPSTCAARWPCSAPAIRVWLRKRC